MNVVPGSPVWEVAPSLPEPMIIWFAAGLVMIWLGARLLLREVLLRRPPASRLAKDEATTEKEVME